MKKHYMRLWHCCMAIGLLLIYGNTNAQTTVTCTSTSPSFWSNSGGAIVFGVRNTNTVAVKLDQLGNYSPANHTASYSLWYHPSNITGTPTAITTANGWVEITPAPASVTSPAVNGIHTVLTNLNFTIPAQTTYRLALVVAGDGPYYGNAGASADLFTNGGVEVYTQNNSLSPTTAGAFPGPPTAAGNKSFYGTLTFTYQPTGQDNAGIAGILLPASVCAGNQDVYVKLSNNGTNILNNVNIHWELDGVPQPVINYFTALDVAGTAASYQTNVLLGNVNFGVAQRKIKVWTSLPNGLPDAINTDDTATRTVKASLSGVFSIGAGGDYATINAAVTDLQTAGVCGPVTFNLLTASSPFTEQVTIPAISGVSATNTITFNGNGSTLQFAPVTTARHIVKLDGADHIIFRNLTVKSTATDFGWGFHLTGAADSNSIIKCTIDMSAVSGTTGNSSVGITATAAANSVLSAGNNGSYLKIDSCTINKVYQGIVLFGAGGAATGGVGHVITNNKIANFYADGMMLANTANGLVQYNDIYRDTATVTGSFTGIMLRVDARGMLVNANRIHDSHTAATNQGTFAYGIHYNSTDAPEGQENVVVNNLIYKLNSATGIVYGIYDQGSDGANIFHNTIVLDNAASTAGNTRGIYQTTTAIRVKIFNNIIYVTRGGTGDKYCLYFNTTASAITSNNNVLYNGATPAATVGIGYAATTGFATLADWKLAVSSAYDANSVSADPLFANAAAGNFIPTQTSIDNIGSYVLAGITYDFTGAARSFNTPDAGAYEFPVMVPVKLLALQAVKKDRNVLVQWVVADEQNLAEYQVERALNGSNFTKVGTVKAAKQSTYTFTDLEALANPAVKQLAYRLKMKDNDGSFRYSGIVAVSNNGNNNIQVGPNPFSSTLNVKLNLDKAALVKIDMVNAAGQTISSRSFNLQQGGHSLLLQQPDALPQGVYWLRVILPDTVQTFKVAK